MKTRWAATRHWRIAAGAICVTQHPLMIVIKPKSIHICSTLNSICLVNFDLSMSKIWNTQIGDARFTTLLTSLEKKKTCRVYRAPCPCSIDSKKVDSTCMHVCSPWFWSSSSFGFDRRGRLPRESRSGVLVQFVTTSTCPTSPGVAARCCCTDRLRADSSCSCIYMHQWAQLKVGRGPTCSLPTFSIWAH